MTLWKLKESKLFSWPCSLLNAGKSMLSSKGFTNLKKSLKINDLCNMLKENYPCDINGVEAFSDMKNIKRLIKIYVKIVRYLI